jgi:hypothetical protein
VSSDQFLAGSRAALEGFWAELHANRDRIESEQEPLFDVIVDLLERTIDMLTTFDQIERL